MFMINTPSSTNEKDNISESKTSKNTKNIDSGNYLKNNKMDSNFPDALANSVLENPLQMSNEAIVTLGNNSVKIDTGATNILNTSINTPLAISSSSASSSSSPPTFEQIKQSQFMSSNTSSMLYRSNVSGTCSPLLISNSNENSTPKIQQIPLIDSTTQHRFVIKKVLDSELINNAATSTPTKSNNEEFIHQQIKSGKKEELNNGVVTCKKSFLLNESNLANLTVVTSNLNTANEIKSNLNEKKISKFTVKKVDINNFMEPLNTNENINVHKEQSVSENSLTKTRDVIKKVISPKNFKREYLNSKIIFSKPLIFYLFKRFLLNPSYLNQIK